jgi:ribulose-bisphosphate carboxylase large chain
MLPPVSVDLSGERFRVIYRFVGDEAEARATAEDTCIEQTVEFPGELVPDGDIRDNILGRIESLSPVDSHHHEAVISYAVETTGFELIQLLNVIFGNTSLKPGVRVERLEMPDSLLRAFKGPRFGREGLRALLDIPDRALLCTALKPMGLPPEELAKLAYQFALGGIDFIKDDHGMADQAFAPYQERVQRCAEAVDRANRETGYRCLYLPNVPGPADRVIDRALFAKQAGAGGLLISPGLLGLDTMRQIADDDRIGLPIMSHPALQGSFVTCPDNGIAHHTIFGQIPRLAGADASIFPNYGGRFSLTVQECMSIVDGTSVSMSHIRPIFPVPSGGMSLERVPDMLKVYGRDIISLIGGGLHKHGPDLTETCRHFRQLVAQMK